MKKTILISFLVILFFNISFAQENDLTRNIREAKEAFDNQYYETTLIKLKEVKLSFKKNNLPPSILSMEIISKCEIIKINPFNDFALIAETRILANSYLKNPNSKNDLRYASVVRENYILNTYPKDLATFNVQKEAKLKQLAIQKEIEEKAAAEKVIRLKREAVIRDSLAVINAKNAKIKYTADSIRAIKNAEVARIKAIEDAKIAAVKATADAIVAAQKQREEKKTIAKINYKNKTFSNFGFKSGEIAKYGLLFEHGGGKNFLGYHVSIRTSLPNENDIINGNVIENKTEFDLGPSFKLSDNFYLNIGGGYGFYNYAFRNDYTGQSPSIEMEKYLVTSGGLTIRLGRLINISAGASFMDIDKGLYTPEITAGLTFNLKSK
jgi:hypothetical protein